MQPSQSRPPELEAAATSWIDYMERVILFNETMHHGIRSALPIGKIADLVSRTMTENPPSQQKRIRASLAQAQQEIDADFEFVHALTLMAAWGAFDAFVEDLCQAMLVVEPQLLEAPAFKGVKLSPEILLVADVSKQMEIVFKEASNKVSADLKVGVGKFESQLKLVGLEGRGDLSDDLKKAMLFAGQVRNVWAHRAGKADSRFIEHCGDHFGVNEGDTLSISTPVSQEFMGAIATYGWLILNRYNLRRGLGRVERLFGESHGHFVLHYIVKWQKVIDAGQPLSDTAQ